MDGYWQDGKYILVSTLQAKYDAEQAKVKKLEGWLKYLYELYHIYGEKLTMTEQEIFDYIKAKVIEEERAIKTPEEQERIAELSFKSVYSIGEMEGK